MDGARGKINMEPPMWFTSLSDHQQEIREGLYISHVDPNENVTNLSQEIERIN